MGWGILAISFLGIFCAFIIVQATLAQHSWKRLVNDGDRWAIRSLVEEEILRWRRSRVPKGQSATLYRGLGNSEVASAGADYVNLIARVEGEYQVVEGRQQETSSPYQEGVKLAAALVERLFYDVPNVRTRIVRVDVYTAFRGEDGAPEQRCILTITADRAIADPLPWDDLLPLELLARFNTRFLLSAKGQALPIDPGPVLTDDDEPLGSPPDDDDARAAVSAAEQLIAGRDRDEGESG